MIFKCEKVVIYDKREVIHSGRGFIEGDLKIAFVNGGIKVWLDIKRISRYILRPIDVSKFDIIIEFTYSHKIKARQSLGIFFDAVEVALDKKLLICNLKVEEIEA